MDFKGELTEKQKIARDIVLERLPKEEGLAKTIFSAMNYSVTAPGKRLRPLMMMETYRMYKSDVSNEVLHCFMAALEYIHTYSLVHDDLPAMDNDDYRRGRKTTHLVYGEAMGILAGDGLLHYAFETATNAFSVEGANAELVGAAMQVLARKSGIYGMVGGQVVDVECEGKEIGLEEIDFIYRLKTAALLECAMMIGAILGGAPECDVKKIEQIARKVGIAFQIQDDILDITSTTEYLGKPVGSDEKNGKRTYAVIKGIQDAENEVVRLSNEAVTSLRELSVKNDFLEELLLSLISRKK